MFGIVLSGITTLGAAPSAGGANGGAKPGPTVTGTTHPAPPSAPASGVTKPWESWLGQAVAVFVGAILLTLLGIYRFRGIDERIDKIRGDLDTRFETLTTRVDGSVDAANRLLGTADKKVQEIVEHERLRLQEAVRDGEDRISRLFEEQRGTLHREAVSVLATIDEKSAGLKQASDEFEQRTGWLREPGLGTSGPSTVGEAHRIASSAAASGRPREAIMALRQIVEHELDGAPQDFHNAGAQASYQDADELAKRIFDIGRSKYPWFVDLHADYAETLSKMGFAEEAISTLEALKKDPRAKQSVRYWVFFGSILTRAGEYRRAERVLTQGQKHFPYSGEILRELARAKLGQNEIAEAENMFKKAIEVEPSEHIAHNLYADFLWERGRIEESKEQLLAAIRFCEPSQANYPTYHYELGRACMAIGEFEEAKTALVTCLSFRERFDRAILLLAKLRMMKPELFGDS